MTMFERTKKTLEGASAGIAVAIAFLNVALIVVKLVQTVTEEASVLESGVETDEIEDPES